MGTLPTEFMREGWSVKREFDYKGGADASVTAYLNAINITPSMRMDDDWIRWKASARPFGFLEVTNASSFVEMPHYFGLVLPAFRQVRLIPNGWSSAPEGVSMPGWFIHIYAHVPPYVAQGLDSIEDNNCYYCKQLIRWEDPAFRQEGDQWLEEFEYRCESPRGGYVGSGGTGDWR